MSVHVRGEFYRYLAAQREQAIQSLCSDEGLDVTGIQKVIDNYRFTGKMPLRNDVIRIMQTRPKLKERSTAGERIISRISAFIETFVDGID